MSYFLTFSRSRGIFFFFNDTATTEIYTLSLHDALPILSRTLRRFRHPGRGDDLADELRGGSHVHELGLLDRKSTRLNSSHSQISYAVFCLKKKINLTLINQVFT